ncbi:MAG: hypothetical protein ABR592_08055 [Nitriliruptorales bacterium]
MHERAVSRSSHVKPGKARFDDIYDRPDPRAYFETLRRLDYQIPQHGQRVFRTLTEARRGTYGEENRRIVLDLCCSYGVNATLLNHELSLEDLYAHYASGEADNLSSFELAAIDRAFFAARRRLTAYGSVGVDAASNAVGYALEVGLLDEGFAENLENSEPSPGLQAAAARAGLITVTGGIGYISQRTFQRILDCMVEPPWIAAFVLRMVSYEPIAEALSRYGLVTEKLAARTFPQRRFAHAEERQYALDELAGAGVDVSSKEACGYYHAELFVSRPAWDAAELSLESLLAGAS